MLDVRWTPAGGCCCSVCPELFANKFVLLARVCSPQVAKKKINVNARFEKELKQLVTELFVGEIINRNLEFKDVTFLH